MCLVAAFSIINLKVELQRSLNLYFLSSFIPKHNKTDSELVFGNTSQYSRPLVKSIQVLPIFKKMCDCSSVFMFLGAI